MEQKVQCLTRGYKQFLPHFTSPVTCMNLFQRRPQISRMELYLSSFSLAAVSWAPMRRRGKKIEKERIHPHQFIEFRWFCDDDSREHEKTRKPLVENTKINELPMNSINFKLMFGIKFLNIKRSCILYFPALNSCKLCFLFLLINKNTCVVALIWSHVQKLTP